MNRSTIAIMLIFYILFIILLVVSIAIYKINQRKMDKIIELYMKKGFCLSTGAYMGHLMGIHGQFYTAAFFYKLLTGKRIRINKPNSKYMPKESYYFIQNLPPHLTHWIKTYFIIANIGGAFFFITMAIYLFQK
ncbi:hypothetical protein [Photorhabdus luminescens]|uniref:hypothetical protein n=1 Tax=Photorhabdus luminescens TaxID=29488 RepID=UPI00223EEE96|nr:hypothetical protein [Photorhabdus luminescens]MCW7764108.1 hypothetical protein [Photorhabdus luminescens subsp. venezuelensis]